jgi:hypothetical protein
MSDVELQALATLVARETAQLEASFLQFGEMQSDPVTPASVALENELLRRTLLS